MTQIYNYSYIQNDDSVSISITSKTWNNEYPMYSINSSSVELSSPQENLYTFEVLKHLTSKSFDRYPNCNWMSFLLYAK